MNLNNKQLNNITKVLKKYKTIFAYLFGSQATGKANKKSDFDFAVMLEEKDSNKRFSMRFKMISEIGRAINQGDNVEVVVLNDIESIFFKLKRSGRYPFFRTPVLRVV